MLITKDGNKRRNYYWVSMKDSYNYNFVSLRTMKNGFKSLNFLQWIEISYKLIDNFRWLLMEIWYEEQDSIAKLKREVLSMAKFWSNTRWFAVLLSYVSIGYTVWTLWTEY